MSARASIKRLVPINYGGGDQALAKASTGVYLTTGGTLVVRLQNDNADHTLTGLIVGQHYDFSIILIKQTSSTAAGFLTYATYP